jgi:hypothetical protein
MLQGSHAYVVAQTALQNRSLVKLASRAGFSSVATVLGADAAPLDHDGEHLSFFLLHHQLSEPVMRAVIGAIRNSPNDNVRFAPVILIIDDCPFETVLKFIQFGYDDVIALPEKREELVSRLSNQLNTEVTYFEANDYLGPDRRRMELPTDTPDERRTGRHAHTRYTIVRSIDKGVRIARQELHGHAIEPAGRHVTSPLHRPLMGEAWA